MPCGRSAPIPSARAAALPPRRLDALIALLFLVEGWLEVLLWSTVEGSRTLAGLGIVTAVAAGVFVRRSSPFAAIALAAGGLMLVDVIGADMADHTAGPFFAVLLVTFTAGTRLEGRRLVAAFLLGASLMLAAIGFGDGDNNVPNLIFTITFFAGAPMLLGQLLVNRARLNRALGDKARRAEAERREQAESAALEERTRIAGELHDVVAHALSAMTVQASAARRLSERDPGRARCLRDRRAHRPRGARRAAPAARRAAQGGTRSWRWRRSRASRTSTRSRAGPRPRDCPCGSSSRGRSGRSRPAST